MKPNNKFEPKNHLLTKNNTDNYLPNTKDGLINKLIEISKKKNSSFSVMNLKNLLIINAISYNIIFVFAYIVFVSLMIFGAIILKFVIIFILVLIAITLLFAWLSKAMNSIQIDFNETTLKIVNRNLFGKMIYKDKIIHFNSIREIYSVKKEIKAREGKSTFKRIYISTKEFKEIPIIDLSVGNISDDKLFISIINRLIYGNYDK